MKRITELAPAKLNLYLKVLGKRPDGYHDIETFFERIDIFDEISVLSTKEGIDIRCNNSSVPTGKGSLCYRTVELLKKETGITGGVSVKIKKTIPIAAGLGGGSSDAASILKALNRLWKLRLSKKRLKDIARLLGADISFFLADTPFAIGRGRGDNIKPVRSRKKFWHLVISPNIELLSGEIYKLYSETYSLTLTTRETIDKILPPDINISKLTHLNMVLYNDLERIVLSREPLIKDIKNTLEVNKRGNVLVSGSGPSVFGLYESRKEALRARRNCLRRFSNSKGWQTFIAKTY